MSSVEDEDVISLSANTASKTITASSANGIRSITITDLTGKSNTRHFGNGEENRQHRDRGTFAWNLHHNRHRRQRKPSDNKGDFMKIFRLRA